MKTNKLPKSNNVEDRRFEQRTNLSQKGDLRTNRGFQRSNDSSWNGSYDKNNQRKAGYLQHNKGDKADYASERAKAKTDGGLDREEYASRKKQHSNDWEKGDSATAKSDKGLVMADVNKTISKDLNDFVKGRRLPSRTYSK